MNPQLVIKPSLYNKTRVILWLNAVLIIPSVLAGNVYFLFSSTYYVGILLPISAVQLLENFSKNEFYFFLNKITVISLITRQTEEVEVLDGYNVCLEYNSGRYVTWILVVENAKGNEILRRNMSFAFYQANNKRIPDTLSKIYGEKFKYKD